MDGIKLILSCEKCSRLSSRTCNAIYSWWRPIVIQLNFICFRGSASWDEYVDELFNLQYRDYSDLKASIASLQVLTTCSVKKQTLEKDWVCKSSYEDAFVANSNSFVRIKRTSKLPFYVTLGYHGSRTLFLSLTHTLLSLTRTFLSYAFADQSAPCGATMVSPPGVTGARGPGTTGGHFRTRPHWNTVLKRQFIVQNIYN